MVKEMAVKNSLSKAPNGAVKFSDFMLQDAVVDQIRKVVGDEKSGKRFATAIISAVNTNPSLAECSNRSIVAAALLGESLKLSPSPQLGQYHLLPFNDRNKGKVAQFVIGYKGLIQLAIRSGQYKKLNVICIKDGELVKYDPLNEEIEVNLIEDVDEREDAPTIGYYAMFEYMNGFRKTIYWSKRKMERHALKYSPGYKAKKGYTFWEKDFDEMAQKTMLKQLLSKWGMLSIEMESAIEDDMKIVNDDGSKMYGDEDVTDEEIIVEPEVVETPKEEKKKETKKKEEPNVLEAGYSGDIEGILFED